MQCESLALGIDLGTSGVRIALINNKLDLIYTESINYSIGIEECKDWENCCRELIKGIPFQLKRNIKSCAIDGTSGTLIACDFKGKPIEKAIPYYKIYSKKSKFIKSLIPEETIRNSSSLGRALHLFEKYGSEILLRSQADWISSWMTEDWELGEEGNNLKLGWDQISKSWPKSFNSQKWRKALPKIISSGNIFNKIDIHRAKELDLPEDLIVIAGTTDSNAAVLAANSSLETGISILGSTIVLKKFVKEPHYSEGVTNHFVNGSWLCGGSSNAGGAVLKKFFTDAQIEELSHQIRPDEITGINLVPLPFEGERFPINDPSLLPVLTPRPTSDSLYLHALFEGLAQIEYKGWQKLKSIGVPMPNQIISIGNGAKNIQWQRIRERVIGIPIRKSNKPPALGAAMIALKSIKNTKK